ncbi:MULTISPECIES: DUF4956 domain-containing protein [unclassified Butyricimonas]|jgi:putative uncharacterized protein (fragment)|uniref:DUF4956 domain-containing protein n=1 Tax=unclassified Butyricimonas TaxID=2637652 RepID=UPI000B3928F5|nr:MULTISPECIES: DUF4956 domain-containing protein [unclassified Butyricimonas]OUN63310.1 DUF4956 domain-containing protein [Butyricimonas sp. An62]
MNSFLDLTEDLLSETPLIDMADLWQLLFRFVFNFIVVGIIIHFFYYPKSKRRDYYFTFTLISISVFFLIFLLGSVKLKIGFALGIFAIFGIIRYRTESVPIREMTYLFTITALSVINALSIQVGLTEMLVTNAIFLLVTSLLESERWLKHTSSKLILYDRIQLITPDKREELIADLSARTGLHIQKIEIGHIDFLRDAAFIKVYYESDSRETNTVDHLTKFPKEGE